MPELVEVVSGLSFPEGPIAMPDGSVILVEMFGPRLTRVLPDGSKETIAEIPGGPNGAAVGPDGAIFVCNNGGRFTPIDLGGLVIPRPGDDEQLHRRADPDASTSDRRGRRPLHRVRRPSAWAPNDIVFDDHGGFYFTDHGLTDESQRIAHMTGIYYAQADGSGSARWSSRPTSPTASVCHPMVASSTGPRPGPDASCSATSRHPARCARRARRSIRVPVRLPRNAVARLARGRRGRQRLRGDDRAAVACRSCPRPAS